MKANVKELEKNRIELEVEVPTGDVSASISEAYKSLAKKINIPGFRKGKVPAGVIDTRLGKGAVFEEALNNDLGNFYLRAVKETGIEPIEKPKIEIEQMEEQKPLKFKATVTVKPQIKLGDYKNFKTQKIEVKVKNDDIKAQLDVLREKFANLEPVDSRPAKKGDFVLVNFDGSVNGLPFEGGSAKDFLLELGSKTLLPEFEVALEGAKKGDIKDVKATIPNESPNKEIAGQVANFRVLVKEIKIKKLPELNEDFVKQLGGAFENFGQLKKEIKSELQKELERQAETELKMSVLKEIVEKAKVDIPQIMIEDTLDRMINDFKHNLKSRGLTMEKYLEETKTKIEDLRSNLKEQAGQQVIEDLALEAIAEKEKIEVSEKEIDEEIQKFAKDKPFDEAKHELEEKGLMGYIMRSLVLRKTLDFLAGQVKS